MAVRIKLPIGRFLNSRRKTRLWLRPGQVGSVACESIVTAAVEGLGGLDVLVNNAGVGGGGPVEETRGGV